MKIPKLREHQNEWFEKVKDALEKNGKSLMAITMSLGKTYIAAFIAKEEITKGRVLFLAHTNFILCQAMEDFQSVLGHDVSLGLFIGNDKTFDEVDILFASFHTMRKWKEAFNHDEFHLVIVDESHHGQAPTYKAVIDYFKSKKLLGMTGTVDRMDMKDIRDIFGNETVNVTFADAIHNGWLAHLDYRVLSDGMDLNLLQKIFDKVNKGTDVTLSDLNTIFSIEERDRNIAQRIIDTSGEKQVIIFCQNIRYLEYFQKFFPNATTCHSKLSAEENDTNLALFRSGEVQFMLARDKFNEGIHIKGVQIVVFLRRSQSRVIWQQQLARGLAKYLEDGSEKESVIVMDFVDNIERVPMVMGFAELLAGDDVYKRSSLNIISGKGFTFSFSKASINVLDILERIQPRRISDISLLLTEYSARNPLSANQVIAGTNQKLWWKCSKCCHEWQALGYNRVKGSGCPACVNKVITSKNNLVITHPNLAKEYSARNPLPANQVIAGTNQKLWWKCSKCCHEWQAIGHNRVKDRGCPACSGRVATSKNNLAVTNPELAKEYSSKNLLPVNQVIAGTAKKLWWKCTNPECCHEWEANGYNRIRGRDCPACSGRVATSKNNLAVTNPELAKEYSSRNSLPAEQVLAGTSKKLWWKCSKEGCGHEWEASGHNRVRGRGCPACSGRVATSKNNLAVTNPELAKEYSSKNLLSAEQVLASTNQKLWWKCSKCCHEWQANGYSRVKGSGCSMCAKERRSSSNN